ncbi:hypothetical protein N781_03655 [Pontibacillus halophilus JSM 076056 = DSM 19796]|uniref:Uncharacterized protein n=1 Tax=Pontibacillus halophilus JSM 076056 = DSM 19796 TaxID=1385510 RepID=A0A0A5GKC0_9BACI|nr:hypothetical protein [Pontibacillus halophilus]KGX91678.1 hypothetical protein N781_03655 [Pontibacillus halophilus JSM 076056 = DSM 19796]
MKWLEYRRLLDGHPPEQCVPQLKDKALLFQMGKGERYSLPIPEAPPIGEAWLQFVHLSSALSGLSVSAHYGDRFIKGLTYETHSTPLLLCAPMDVPFTIIQDEDGTEVLTCKPYTVPATSWNVIVVGEDLLSVRLSFT